MSSNHSLGDRLKFMNMDGRALARLRGIKPLVMAAMPEALDAFYDKIQNDEATKSFLADPAKALAARKLQHAHWDVISDASFDEHYLKAATRAGEVHARVGLEPRWYIGGYTIIVEKLIAAVLKARWPKPSFWRRKSDSQETADELTALAKAVFLDMDIVISVYLASADKARAAVEERARATNAAVIQAVGEAMAALAGGDLTHRVGDVLPPEYAKLRTDFNIAAERLAATLSGIQSAMSIINTSIEEIAYASDDLAKRTEQQAANLLETTTALNELTEAVKQTAQGAAQANVAVSSANSAAVNSRGVVTDAGAAMSQIEASSQEIGQIIGLIDDIAFQTNLLALNAGVEAARAGDAGRGFAVVASEVRALAQRSAEAAKAIKTLISTSSAQVSQGVELVRKTGQTLESIGGNVAQIEGLMSGIATSAQNQSGGLNQVSEAVNQMNQVVQQNAAMVEQSTAATHSLRAEIDQLNRSISAFKLSQGQNAAPVSRGHAAVAARRLALTEAR